ncbi:glycosyl transferase family 2 [Mariniflexile fucanivorans]|uniref:Glycosyl transferase family 2 n=1 Tax=Mariniflexile fucanivorans TaxID=264023 RepID=A0A4R1RKU4_9FLAO|nr:glycosyltransferase [Mariniflexile fucanivorans]TCL66649.1 glycosyl transferase family 2 [Mariniflexile fucanivorans]
MLSILIPTYHFNVVPLVKELHKQCIACDIVFEILVYDDGSKSELNSKNTLINSLQNCTFKELPHNIGRSAIRNLLAVGSKYENLLFLDADVKPKDKNFIKNYLSVLDKTIIYGGIIEKELPPKKPYVLRWLYTKKRESKKGLHSSNFLIKKELFRKNNFDESLLKYGYEDYLFFNSLKKQNMPVFCLRNPAIHNTDDDAVTFIEKTENSIKNLIEIIEKEKIETKSQNISKKYELLKRAKLNMFVAFIYKNLRPLLIKNFNSSHPSLFLFDFYKLGYYCTLKNKK